MDLDSSPDVSVISDISVPPSATEDQTPPRPRLPSSPNLFRNFFSDGSSSSADQAAILPSVDDYQETLGRVRSALHNADMAVRDAQDAFRSGRSQTSRQSVVDLTDSPPQNTNEDLFMSQTTHPHDPVRGMSAIRNAMNPMHEPVYGHQHHFPVTRARSEYNLNNSEGGFGAFSTAGMRGLHAYHNSNLPFWLQPQPTSEVETRRQEEAAVRRQRQARRDWQRLEAHRARQQERTLQDHQQPSSPPAQQSSSSANNSSTRPSTGDSSAPSNMEPVDLTQVEDDTSLAAALAKQRQDAVASQNTNISTNTSDGRTAFSGYKCAICMEAPTNATTTVCGHLFCHHCVVNSLKWSEQLRRQEQQRRNVKGLCPVCRTPLSTKDVEGNGRGLVPLEIRLMPKSEYNAAKQGLRSEVKGKGKASDVDLAEDIAQIKEDDSEKEGKANLKKRKREESTDKLFSEFIEDEV